jgi:predicted permease
LAISGALRAVIAPLALDATLWLIRVAAQRIRITFAAVVVATPTARAGTTLAAVTRREPLSTF